MTSALSSPVSSVSSRYRAYESYRFEFPVRFFFSFCMIYCPVFIILVAVELFLMYQPAELAAQRARLQEYRQTMSAEISADLNAVLDGTMSADEAIERNLARSPVSNPLVTRQVQESPHSFQVRMTLLWSLVASVTFFGVLFAISIGSKLLDRYRESRYYYAFIQPKPCAYA